MTITTATPTYIQLPGNGTATTFAFPFKVFQATDVVVGFISGSGYTLQAAGYSVTNVDNNGGGNVVFTVAPPIGTTVDIRSFTPQTQKTEFANLGSYLPENSTEAMDRLTRILQDLSRLTYTFGIHGPDTESTPWPALPAPVSRLGMALLFDPVTGLPTVGVPTTQTITGSVVAGLLNLITAVAPTADKVITLAEIIAGVTPVNYAYQAAPYDVRREGPFNSADDTATLNTTILVAAQTVNGATGAVVSVPTGLSPLSSMVPLPNRVRVVGQNKRGTWFQAVPAWNSATSPWMFHASNGTSSMFDSTLENFTIDCNNIVGLGGVLSDAWQENCGLRRVLILNLGTYGMKVQNGYGGASFLKVSDTEIFAGTVANTIGIDVEQMSASGAVFMLGVQTTSITGGTAVMLKGINMVAENLHCWMVHFEVCTHGIYLNGAGNHTLIGVTGAPTVTNLVTLDPMFNGTLTMLGCFRNGGTYLLNDQRLKQISQLGAITGGSGYTNGTYNQVPLTGGSGTGATAQVVVSGGVVTQANMSIPGTNYLVGDVLSASPSSIGGSGSGFSVPVFQTFTGSGLISGDSAQVRVLPGTQTFGLSSTRSPTELEAWGIGDGTLTGTNAPTASQNVLSMQRTGPGRYVVTLANPVAVLIPLATCASPLLTVSTTVIGANSFSIAIDNSSTGVATDQNEIKFMVAGR